MDEIESTDVVTEDVIGEETPADAPEPTEEKPAAEKPKETPEQKVARLARQYERAKKEAGIVEDKPAPKAKADGLDDTALDYLDLKGVSESEDVAVIEAIMKKTGMSAREALKDEYVTAKLKANKEAREVKDATPSSTKRGSGVTADAVSRAVARFEKDGIMPDDFDLASKVTDAIVAKAGGSNAPRWHQ